VTQSDYVSLGAAAVALLAAVYSRRSAKAAARANRISLHAYKVAIYEEVVSFSDCFRGLFTVPSVERLERFQKAAVNRSEIYLSNEAHKLLKDIYDHCWEKEIWLSIAESEGSGSGNKPEPLQARRDYKTVLNLLYPAIEKIKVEAKIHVA